VIGAVGRLEQEKNFDLLLRAFNGVVARHPRTRLVILGEGSCRALLEQRAAELGFNGRCRFLGHVQNVARLHQALDLFVQSSDHEGTPNAVLEAMACGTPIVATNAGGTADLARPDRDAVIVPIRDVEALAAGIDRALADENATRERARSARRRIETELSFGTRIRRLEALYDEMMARRTGYA
jgi:glycosyltransferase involved in cell wall biosynthesis